MKQIDRLRLIRSFEDGFIAFAAAQAAGSGRRITKKEVYAALHPLIMAKFGREALSPAERDRLQLFEFTKRTAGVGKRGFSVGYTEPVSIRHIAVGSSVFTENGCHTLMLVETMSMRGRSVRIIAANAATGMIDLPGDARWELKLRLDRNLIGDGTELIKADAVYRGLSAKEKKGVGRERKIK